MTDHDPTAAIAAQLAEQRERLAAADAREQAHHQALTNRLNELTRLVQEAVKDEAPILATVKQLEEAVATMAAKLAEVAPDDRPARVYKPSPTPQVWRLNAEAKQQLTRKLSAWVHDVYRPLYGHLAARLPGCWPQHDLAIVILDVLSELQLYYTLNKRTPGVLAAQGEFTVRILPGLTELLAAECARCQRHAPAVNGRPIPVRGGQP
jgi:predicted GTPase